MKRNLASGLATLIIFTGCGAVKVVRTGPTAEAKPPNCELDFVVTPPARQFIELAELTRYVHTVPAAGSLPERGRSMEAADEALHEEACRQGADAVLVTLVTVVNANGYLIVSGKALKYMAPPEPPPPSPGGETPAPAPAPATPAPESAAAPAPIVAPTPAPAPKSPSTPAPDLTPNPAAVLKPAPARTPAPTRTTAPSQTPAPSQSPAPTR